MSNLSRRHFLAAAGAAAAGAGCPIAATAADAPSVARGGTTDYVLGGRGDLRLDVAGLAEEVRFQVIGDTHFALRDSRDDAYADYYARMGQWGAKKEPFEQMLANLKKTKPDLLLLVGDNISFPTLANVEYLKSSLDKTGLDWYYVAGNHDWHFEGVPGSDEEQRAEWIAKRLTPLYRGLNPLMSSRVVKGVRFIAIDNSIYHVSPEQLAFYRAEAAKGDPVVLFMHIPMWVPEWGIHTCGCPQWGAATDPYWKIERREKWAERQSPSTFAFREAILSTPNLVGVFTGHHHMLMVAREKGRFMLSVPGNTKGASVAVTLKRASASA